MANRLLDDHEYAIVYWFGLVATSAIATLLVIAVAKMSWAFVVLGLGLLCMDIWIARRAYRFE